VQRAVNAMVKAQLWTREHRAETAALLSKDNPNQYTPHSVEVLSKVLAPSETDDAAYIKAGAIKHPDWRERRIDFQPYPYPSYTEELIRRLRDTLVEGDRAFLDTLDPAVASRELVDDRFVKKAVIAAGGMAAFGLAESFTRSEVVAT
jgi:NitT/TauT family transport system substrate-binding protein